MANQIGPHLAPSLAKELAQFCDEAWPPQKRARVALKSQLYAWVDFGANSKPKLKPEAREALRELEPEIMKDLVTPTPTHGLDGLFSRLELFENKPLLDQLLQRDALGPFDFLTLPGAVATP